MIDLQHLKKVKRIHTDDKRNFNLGLRADRNEKVEDWPIGIFNKIFKNIKTHEFTSYYNTTEIKKIKSKIGKYFKLNGDNFIINHGGDGVIKEFLLLNYKNKLKVLINANNYEMYKVYFNALKIKCIQTPYISNLKEKNIFRLNKSFFQKNISKVDIIFLTNPNQISNNDFSISEMKKICNKYPKKKFFIDESYYGFGSSSFLSLTQKYKNIFVMRSITKTFGLASARIGFLISHKESIKSFKALETPYPISLFSGKCLDFFLDNKKLLINYNLKVKEGREFICNQLIKKKYIVHNSNGLSVFIYFKNKKDLKHKHSLLEKKFIYTRAMQINNINFLRITSGPKKQMQKILRYF